MGYFQVRYDSRVVNYDRRGFIRLATGQLKGCVMFCYKSSADEQYFTYAHNWLQSSISIFIGLLPILPVSSNCDSVGILVSSDIRIWSSNQVIGKINVLLTLMKR